MILTIFNSIAGFLGAKALKIGLAALTCLVMLGTGFVWGDEHAAKVALQVAVKDADARVAAAQKSTQVLLQNYLGEIAVQNARGNSLASTLAQAQSKLAAQTKISQETVFHTLPANPSCDIPDAAIAVLRGQSARN